MKGALPTVLGGLAGGAAGRKLGAMEVASQFPGFHATHGYTHETIAMLAMAIIGSIVGYHIGAKRATNEIQDTIQP